MGSSHRPWGFIYSHELIKVVRSANSLVQQHQFTALMVAINVIFITLTGVYVTFDEKYAMPYGSKSKDDTLLTDTQYPNFADTHMMIFVGFGFIITFLKRYGFSAVGMNMLLACVTIEWAILCRGFLSTHFAKTGKISLNIDQMLQADFSAATNLISLGAMLGKLSPMQYVVMVLIETPAAVSVEYLVTKVLFMNDVGDSIVVHVFGCYFGLACSLAFAKKQQRGHKNEGVKYHAQIFALIAIINTLLSLVGCTISTFLTSQMLALQKKFNLVHITNATLAGGVAIGTCANVVLDPVLSLFIGSFSGVASVLGYIYLSPYLSSRFGIHDSCGVHNIHGIPGIISGIFAAIMAVAYRKERLGASLVSIYPAIAHNGQTESGQALMQLAGLGTVLGCSIIAGALTGIVLRAPFLNQVRDEEFFSDGDYFGTPDDYEFTTRIAQRIKLDSKLDGMNKKNKKSIA